MEKFDYDGSMKDIPIPSKDEYRKLLLFQTESFIQRLRWKSYFFLHPDSTPSDKVTYGFKTSKTAPQLDELSDFEHKLADLVSTGIIFRTYRNSYQRELEKTVTAIHNNKHYLLPADKTTNTYSVSGETYQKLLMDHITQDYKQTTRLKVEEINQKSREIASELGLADRIEEYSDTPAFVTLKDHKKNFETERQCRLINPAKNQIGKISKQMLQKVNKEIRESSGLVQWQSTKSALDWFKAIPNKKQKRFIQYDVCAFYPSITKALLEKALDFADSQLATPIPEESRKLIVHARESLLFTVDPRSNTKIPWTKKNGTFDVTMGAPDGAEICELVGLFLLKEIRDTFPDFKSGLYRDDGLGYVSARMTGHRLDQIRKQLIALFKFHGLKIEFEKLGKTLVNFLDVTLDLETETFKPYRKPNDRPLYVHSLSNHPPSVIKAIPKSINRRLSSISSSANEFNKAKGDYQTALQNSGYNHILEYEEPRPNQPPRRRKKSNRDDILWFNPPWNQAVKTRVGAKFLGLIKDCFPRGHPLRKIINRNTVKVSYCTCKNIARTIKSHNSKIIRGKKNANKGGCNCQQDKKEKCPIKDNCNQENVVYEAHVQEGEEKKYIGSTIDFKKRWYGHTGSFRNEKVKSSTTLSTHVWNSGLNPEPKIKWSILTRAEPYQRGGRMCDLCLSEKLAISKHFNNPTYLNKRSELALRCRHRRKFLLIPSADDTTS